MEESKKLGSRFLELWAETIDEGLVPRVLIVSNRHQQGKSATMIRIMEKVQEEIHGRKFDIADLCLETLEYMERSRQVPEWTPIGLDEPERPIGNKTWFTEEAQAFVEFLMTSPFRHLPFLCALPHAHYLNNSIFGVATSMIVKLSKSRAALYEMDRDMLNRTGKTYTRGRGEFTVGKPYDWDWQAYVEKRNEFDVRRGKMLEEKVRSLQVQAKDLSKEMVYQIVAGDPDKFRPGLGKPVSQSYIEAELGVSYNYANFAAHKFNRKERKPLS